MPGNDPIKDERRNAAQDGRGRISLPPVPPSDADATALGQALTSEAQRLFDQQVKHYGEGLKEELIRNTKLDFSGNSEWRPYQLNLDQIPKEYHERVAHYILQAHKLPHADLHVAYNANVFHNLDKTALAKALIVRGHDGASALGQHLHNFKGVDQSFLLRSLLHNANFCEWADNIDFFAATHHRTIVIEVLNDFGYEEELFKNLHKLRLTQEDHREIVDKIFQSDRSDKLEGFSHQWAVADLVRFLHKFTGIDCGKVLLRAATWSHEAALEVASNLHRYPMVDTLALADACEAAQLDPLFGAQFNTDLRPAIEYMRDFPDLSEAEKVRRLLEFRAPYILANLQEYRMLSHFEIAQAHLPDYLFELLESFDKLTELTAADKLALVNRIIDEDERDCEQLIENFEKFAGLDLRQLSETILSRYPRAFLKAGSFLGFTAREILSRIIKKSGVPQDDGWTSFDGDATPVCWIRFGGHDREIATAFIEAGQGRLVIENLSCFTGLTPKDLQEAALQGAFWCINNGLVDTARSYVIAHGVCVDLLNQQLVDQLKTDLSLKHRSSAAILRRTAVAAWSLYYPEILETKLLRKRPGLVVPFRKLFGPTDTKQLEKNTRQKLLENLVSKGIPAFLKLRWLRPDTLDSLASILPSFLESATGSASAWTAHLMNLGVDSSKFRMGRRKSDASRIIAVAEKQTKTAAALLQAKQELGISASPQSIKQRARQLLKESMTHPLSGRSVNPQAELRLLRDFYRDFGVIQAPELYLKRYRLILPSSAAEFSALRDELRNLHNVLAREIPPKPADFAPEHLEYLAAWTRAKRHEKSPNNQGHITTSGRVCLEKRMKHFESTWQDDSLQGKDHRLSIRRLKVQRATESSAATIESSSVLSALYARLREALHRVKDLPVAALVAQEKKAVRTLFEAQLKDRNQWLKAEEAVDPGSSKAKSGRAQVARIQKCLDALREIQGTDQLIELLCRISDDGLKGSVITLFLALGLERVHEREEFLQSLELTPSQGAVRRMVEFLANEVRDAALRPLKAEPKVLRTAEKYLALPELKKALMRVRLAESGTASPAPSPMGEELLVLPTRGLLAEIAGFFSDACWTDHDYLMRDHPNATGLIFLKRDRPTTDQELRAGSIDLSDAKLLGACYMLLAKDTAGNDVLVLRGINPREKVIEHLDSESFIEQLLDQAMVPYAKALGASKVVVPFDDLGHAQTNRQLISEYLHRRYADTEYVPLDPKGPKTEFNNRLIFDKCGLLRLVSPASSF